MLGSGAASPILTQSVADSFTLADAVTTLKTPSNLTQSVSDSFTLSDAVTATIPSSLLTGIIAFWKLGEASGTRNDSVGSNHLSDNNTVTQATGKVGNGADFTAINNESLSITDNADLSLESTDFTISLWLNADLMGAYRRILGKSDGGTSIEYLLQWNTGDFFTIYAGNGSTFDSTNFAAQSLTTGTWYFVVLWKDTGSGFLNIQVNNGTPETLSTIYPNTATGLGFFIGGIGTEYFDGVIDAVGVWKRVLTADERTALYNSGNGIEYPF
jgi:hypothetical protein